MFFSLSIQKLKAEVTKLRADIEKKAKEVAANGLDKLSDQVSESVKVIVKSKN